MGDGILMALDKLTSQRASSAYSDALSRANSLQGAHATQGSPGADPTPAVTAAPASAVIALSPEAQLFARALAAAQATPDGRADHVAALQARMANRSADVNADALAAKLLGNTQ
jgi:hypothetical protein